MADNQGNNEWRALEELIGTPVDPSLRSVYLSGVFTKSLFFSFGSGYPVYLRWSTSAPSHVPPVYQDYTQLDLLASLEISSLSVAHRCTPSPTMSPSLWLFAGGRKHTGLHHPNSSSNSNSSLYPLGRMFILQRHGLPTQSCIATTFALHQGDSFVELVFSRSRMVGLLGALSNMVESLRCSNSDSRFSRPRSLGHGACACSWAGTRTHCILVARFKSDRSARTQSLELSNLRTLAPSFSKTFSTSTNYHSTFVNSFSIHNTISNYL